ncbi:MAG: N-acyl homoserine lactonase family protein [Anaerolineae bacterium]|nr:N-acyl homoserine lactonase family protein [Anaerolineae bacterium]
MIKVFPLTVGSTRVPFGQFYGGLDGWTGFGALRRFATDKAHPLLVPISAYLIEHPSAGPILVDTGINSDQAHAHHAYYHGFMGVVTDEDEYVLTDAQELPAQLERHGYRCQDIQRVVLTHLHEDHVGGLRHVAHAEVILPQAEWELRNQHYFGLFPAYYAPSFAMVQRWKLIEFSSEAFHSFDSSYDVLGDGTIRLVPTPGHTGGHASVIIKTDGYHVLLAADALYTLRHLDVEHVRAFVPGNEQRVAEYVDSVQRIRALRDALPDLIVVPTHDHSDYGMNLIPTAFADGMLSSTEIAAIRAYEARTFDAQWALKRGTYPHYVPPAAQHETGEVIYGQ